MGDLLLRSLGLFLRLSQSIENSFLVSICRVFRKQEQEQVEVVLFVFVLFVFVLGVLLKRFGIEMKPTVIQLLTAGFILGMLDILMMKIFSTSMIE